MALWRGRFRLGSVIPLGRCRLASVIPASGFPSEVPVMIVGAGPVGVTLSILLAKLGVKSLLVEKKSELLNHPQAHFINNRTMEIFRRLDGLGAQIQSLQPPLEHWKKFIYCTALDGPIIGTVDQIRPEDLTSNRSPTSVAHLSQNRLLPLLLENAKKCGISVSSCCDFQASDVGSIFMGCECVSVLPSSKAVFVDIRQTNSKLLQKVACKYLIAADGAGSSVRKYMGIKLEGERDLQHLINIHFTSKQLGDYLAKNRPGMLYFVFNPAAIAVIVAHDLRCGEFVAQMPFYPPQQNPAQFTNEACREMITGLMSMPVMDLEVKRVNPWIMHAEVAERYISGEGRVILAGDAAHRFPPAGGFGMNTGIQDAHNLAWKLAAVVKGISSPELIQTYEDERRPIAQANTALSLSNFKAAMSIPSALGLDPSYARKVHETVNLLPKGFQSTVLDTVFSVGRAQVSPFFLNKYNPVAQARLLQVEKILKEGKSLQLQFPSQDLFFRYKAGALVKERKADEEGHVGGCMIGVRLPHMNMKLVAGVSDSVEESFSSLDMIDNSRVEFMVIVGMCASGIEWAEDALRIASSCSLPVKVVMMIDSSTDLKTVMKEEWGKGKRVVRVMGEWWGKCGVPVHGVMVVRPDDHIAWMCEKEHGSNSFLQLKEAFVEAAKLHCTIPNK